MCSSDLVDFDVSDALRQLKEDGIVTEEADGRLTTLPPGEAAKCIDRMWDSYLDNLASGEESGEGVEFEGGDEGA